MMKRLITVIILMGLVPMCAFHAMGQGFNSGFNANLIGFKLVGQENTSTDPERPLYVTAEDVKAFAINVGGTVGFEFPIHKFSDDLAIGASLNIGVGFLSSPKLEGINSALAIDFPEYITLWYGHRNSFDDSKKNYGLGIGLGYSYTFTALPYQSPNLMIDFATYSGWIIRLNMNLFKYTYYYYYTSEGDVPAAKISQFGLQIIYGM